MQNDHNELWNLVDLIQKDHLGSWERFKYSVSMPIKNGRFVVERTFMIEIDRMLSNVLLVLRCLTDLKPQTKVW